MVHQDNRPRKISHPAPPATAHGAGAVQSETAAAQSAGVPETKTARNISAEIAAKSSTDTSSRAVSTTPLQEQSHSKQSTSPLRTAADSLLSGVGQIMFGDKPITGAFFLGGLALASPLMAAGAAVGSCIGSLSALVMRCDRSEIHQGLYGFNASLVGLATLYAFGPSIAACSLMVAGCVASTAITSAMRRLSIAHYTAPFIVSTWATWAIGTALELSPSQHIPSLLPNFTADPFGTLHGLGQVLFQESAVVGLIFASGLFLSSRKAAAAGVLGALCAGAVATAAGFSSASIAAGLFGYNAALSAIALKDKPACAALASVVTVPLCAAFGFIGSYIGAPALTLTAPFVLSTWIVSAALPTKTSKTTASGTVPL